MLICKPSSRFHLMSGFGYPSTWHVSDTFAPSRTIASELLIESDIDGGTVENITIINNSAPSRAIHTTSDWYSGFEIK